jgi:hypothetical protein
MSELDSAVTYEALLSEDTGLDRRMGLRKLLILSLLDLCCCNHTVPVELGLTELCNTWINVAGKNFEDNLFLLHFSKSEIPCMY